MKNLYDKLEETVTYLSKKTDINNIDLAIVLGSGLGSIVDKLDIEFAISFSDIPHFPLVTVEGHSGKLYIGKLFNKKILIYQGRYHYYEGYNLKEVTYPIYLLKLLNVEKVLLTNSCGGINNKLKPGDFLIINDFINLMPSNPLIGINDNRLGPRFPDMTEPFDKDLIKITKVVAEKKGIRYIEGVYAGFMGPYYETKAEINAFKIMGADAIGMSTVPEVIVSNYLGIKVLAIATITNMATGIQTIKHSHSNVLKIATESSKKLSEWILEIIKNI